MSEREGTCHEKNAKADAEKRKEKLSSAKAKMEERKHQVESIKTELTELRS